MTIILIGERGHQGIARKLPLELESGVSACSVLGLFSQGPGEITLLGWPTALSVL